MKVKLTHQSNHPDATGQAGDIVDAPQAIAERWLADGGAVAVDARKPPAAAKPAAAETKPAGSENALPDLESGDSDEPKRPARRKRSLNT